MVASSTRSLGKQLSVFMHKPRDVVWTGAQHVAGDERQLTDPHRSWEHMLQ